MPDPSRLSRMFCTSPRHYSYPRLCRDNPADSGALDQYGADFTGPNEMSIYGGVPRRRFDGAPRAPIGGPATRAAGPSRIILFESPSRWHITASGTYSLATLSTPIYWCSAAESAPTITEPNLILLSANDRPASVSLPEL